MRIVAGSAGGRRIQAPPGADTRPTTDRVREAVFNALGSLGAVDGALVADLFAGSGALGLEALSRGASHVHLVESDRRAADVVAGNLAALGFADRATLHRTTVEAALPRLPDDLDLVLADPPYAFDGWVALLDALEAHLDPDGVVVIETDRSPDLPPGWEVARERTYGGTVVVFALPPVPVTGPGDAADPTGADA